MDEKTYKLYKKRVKLYHKWSNEITPANQFLKDWIDGECDITDYENEIADHESNKRD